MFDQYVPEDALPLSQLQDTGSRWFGIELARPLSMRFRDHGARDGSPLLLRDARVKAAIAEFKDALARYGQAKLKLRARVIEEGQTAVDVTAAFVVTR